MQRRTFLTMMGTSVAAAAAAASRLSAQTQTADAVQLQPAAQPATGIRHWAWGGGRGLTSDRGKERLAQMRKAGLTGLLLSGGNPEELAPVLANEGIELHRWQWVMNQPGMRELREEQPELFVINRKGESCATKPPYVGYYRWLCPSREPVFEILRDMLVGIANTDGIAGVHFDYIRYPDVILPVGIQPKYDLVQDSEFPEFDYCYCEVCREKFTAMGHPDPLEMEDPTQNVAWRQYRYDSITRIVNRLIESIKAAQPDKPISAAVFPSPDLARTLVRQDWAKWHLDKIMPMMYHGFYNEEIDWIGEMTRQGVAALPASCKLYSGIMAGSFNPDELARAAELSFENGGKGLAMFTYNALRDEHWQRLGEVTKHAGGA